MPRRTPIERIGAVALGGAAAFLVPWIVHLGRTLPQRTVAENWPLAWVGLDGAIAAGLSGTVALRLAHDRRAAAVGVATATLMLADSWFDVCTAAPGSRWWAVASACCEVPLALLCIAYARGAEPAPSAESEPACVALGSPRELRSAEIEAGQLGRSS